MKNLFFLLFALIFQNNLFSQSNNVVENIGLNSMDTHSFETTFFNLKKLNSGIELDWRIASETNDNGFMILKSSDGVDWEPIGFEESTLSNIQNYQFEDIEPFPGMNFYKLRQIDENGNFKDSKIHSIQFEVEDFAVLVFPNPTEDILNIRFEDKASRVIELRNSTGQLIFTEFLSDELRSEISLKKYESISGISWLTIRDTHSGKILSNRKISFSE